jgi:hypothetical protein
MYFICIFRTFSGLPIDIYHLHLMMEYCYASPILWLFGPNNIQFMIGNSEFKVTWWLMAKAQ